MYWNSVEEYSGGSGDRLIETWDVLKCKQKVGESASLEGLIETWDVLKSF